LSDEAENQEMIMGQKNGIWVLVLLLCLGTGLRSAEIHDRVKANDLAAVKGLIEADPQVVNLVDEGRRTPLHWAARGGNPEMIRLLVEKGADVNAGDENGIAPLHSLASRGHVEGARVLLAGGADVNKAMPNRQTAIYLAALQKDLEMVRLLGEHKADLEHVDDYGRTVLVLASREMTSLEMVRLLLDLGAHVNAADRWQDTALTLAAWRGTGDVVNLLLDRQASIPNDLRQRTQLLQFTVGKNLSRLFGLLMDAGTEVTGRDDRGRTLVHAAAEGGAVPMIQALLAKGLGINPTDDNGWTPLHFAADMGRHEALAFLIQQGADLQARTRMGQTAANLAADNHDAETLNRLKTGGLALTPPRFPELRGPYLGQKAPGRRAEVFAPGIVSARNGLHSSIVFSPDGTEAFWAVMLPDRAVGYSGNRTFQSKLEKGLWTYPREAVFEGVKLEDVPFFHPDGKTLYDMAVRPFPDGRNTGKENLWAWPKGKKGWQKPLPLPPEVNDAISHWQFSLDRSGNLYFCATRAEGLGQHDVYLCRFENGRYLRPENLGARINSPGSEEYPYITPDGQTLLLVRNYNIYASFKDPSGQWSKARAFGPEVNTRSIEQLPVISPDGKYLFFNRDQKSHWIDASIIDDIRQIEVARFGQTSAAEALEPLLTAGKIEEARARFNTLRTTEMKNFFIDEAEFNALGYRFLQQRNLPAAVAVMEMNTAAFPDSWNAWDSLGEALMVSGYNERAEQAYEKSLTLNPENQNGREKLRVLRSERLGGQ
jgi:ankyrin repeat protein/tetratricopeptide (TPR) repeat protein